MPSEKRYCLSDGLVYQYFKNVLPTLKNPAAIALQRFARFSAPLYPLLANLAPAAVLLLEYVCGA